MSDKLTKAETIALVAEKAGLPKAQVERVLDAVTEVATAALYDGKSLSLAGGTLSGTARAERQGRHPQTGEAITIKASRGVNFKPGTALKTTLNS